MGDYEDYQSEGEEQWDDDQSGGEEQWDDDQSGGEEEYGEQEYRPEMGAFGEGGRVGGPSRILGSIIDPSELRGKKMSDIAKKLSRISMTPAERLAIYVDALSRKMNDDEVLKISDNMINVMTTYIKSLKNPGHINPIGFILGYVATDGGKSMAKAQVKIAMGATKKLDGEGGMTEPDVIRYSRLWTGLSGA